MSTILYDDKCVLCNSFLRFLKTKKSSDFSYIAIESEAGQMILNGSETPDSVAFYNESTLVFESEAVFRIISEIGWPYRLINAFAILPLSWTDAMYQYVAKRRYLIFGKIEACPIDSSESTI